MVLYDRLSKCALKIIDEEANLVLFTREVDSLGIGDEVADVVVHGAGMSWWWEVTSDVTVGTEVGDDAIREACPLGHRRSLVAFVCQC